MKSNSLKKQIMKNDRHRLSNIAKIVLFSLLVTSILSACEYHQASPILYWGSVPDEKAILVLKSMGIKSVINLRTNSHKGRTRFARANGMNFYHIKCGVAFTPELTELRKFLIILSDPANRPAFVCCNIGIDRTTYFVAAYRIAIEGWTVQQAEDEMRAHCLKQWWYTFTKYKDSLRSNEAAIRRIARELHCPQIIAQDVHRPCPCLDLGRMKDLSDNPIIVKEIEVYKNAGYQPDAYSQRRKPTNGDDDVARADWVYRNRTPNPPGMARIGPVENRFYLIRKKIDLGLHDGRLTQAEADDFSRELARLRGLDDTYATKDGFVTLQQRHDIRAQRRALDESVELKLKANKSKQVVAKGPRSAATRAPQAPYSWRPSRWGGFYDASCQINGLIPAEELSRYGGMMADGSPVSSGKYAARESVGNERQDN